MDPFVSGEAGNPYEMKALYRQIGVWKRGPEGRVAVYRSFKNEAELEGIVKACG
jgi:hypothetical protein